jgi:aminoacrylate hydrolase
MMRVTRPDGASLVVDSAGAGPDMLLISGLGGSAAFWAPLVPILRQTFRLIRFDQRGIGASHRGAAPLAITTLADDAIAILDALHVESAIIVGHSTGGLIAQALAVRQPQRSKALVLSASWVVADTYVRTLFANRLIVLERAPEAYESLALFLSYPPDWLAQRPALLASVAEGQTDTASRRALIAERIEALLAFDGAAALAEIVMPVLVLSAADDHIIPAYHQRRLAAALAQADIQVFESGGHFFPHTRAEGYCQAIGDWYRRIN